MVFHIVFVLASIVNHAGLINAFLHTSIDITIRNHRRKNQWLGHVRTAILLSKDVNSENQDMSIDPEDHDLFRELQQTKQNLYGQDIPIDEELRQSTLDAENAFLAAMLEQSSQFKQIKSEYGSDRAVEVFMDRIKEEENPGEGSIEEEGDNDKGSRFVQRMYEQQNPEIAADDETSWQ